jgi:hypothetical protein
MNEDFEKENLRVPENCQNFPVEPLPKKPRLSLSLKKNRFHKATKQELSMAKKGFVPSNTARSNNWALNNFNTWFTNFRANDGEILVLKTFYLQRIRSYSVLVCAVM